MVYLQVENVTKSFGDLVLFNDLSLSIHKGEKVAVIARNGAGKTTLLNIIAKKDSPDSGKITYRNDIRVGYLDQNPDIDPSLSIFDQVFHSLPAVADVIKHYEQAMFSGDQMKIEKALAEMDAAGAWDYEVRVKQVLNQLKLDDLTVKVGELSGGQKKRLALATLLVELPDLMILDEPTNHLDLEMIEWIEEYLSQNNITLLMVTHDRYFLDRICTGIFELDDKRLYSYKGNYSYFLEKRDERISVFNAEVDKARNILRKELDWMRRMPKARGTKAKSRVDAFYEVQEKAARKKYDVSVEIKVGASRLGKKILEIAYLNKSFGSLQVLKDFTYIFRHAEKIGVVGKNGSGKTTFLNLITGLVKPDSGSFEYGETVVLGYYKQEQAPFPDDKKVIDVLRDIAEVVTMGDGKKLSVSQFLNHFLFAPSMHHQPVSKLSGGERRRLQLVSVLMKSPNFLILDEPTNDLDIMTLNVLEEYLQAFPGCVLVVTHDRFFLDKIVDHLFVFEQEGNVKDFPGNYTQYRDWAAKRKKNVQVDQKPKPDIPDRKANKEKPRRLSYNERREMEMLEKEISDLTGERSQLEYDLSNPSFTSEQLVQKSIRLGEIIQCLDEKEMRWLELSDLE